MDNEYDYLNDLKNLFDMDLLNTFELFEAMLEGLTFPYVRLILTCMILYYHAATAAYCIM